MQRLARLVNPQYMPKVSIIQRQLSLAKFIDMPSGIKAAPPQQASLNEMWKKGPKSNVVTASTSKGKGKADDGMDIDDAKSIVSESSAASKRKDAITDEMEEEAMPKARMKKRRIMDSDEEEEEVVPPITKKSKPKPPSKAKHNASSEVSKSKSKAKPKSSKAVPPPPATDDDMDDPQASTHEESEAEEAPAKDDDEPELSDEEEEEVVGRLAKMASKHKLVDVDIPGGWKTGDPIPYAALAHTFSLIESTSKRLEITSYLTSFFLLVMQRRKEGDTDSLRRTVYLCINRLCPDFVGVELGIGESLLVKAIGKSAGMESKDVQVHLKKEGDLGLVAMRLKGSQPPVFKPKPLTLPYVFSNLEEIARTEGNSSQAKKIGIIVKLLAACQGSEAKYIIRSLEGKLRIRLAERTVLVSIAHAAVLNENKKWKPEQLAEKLEEGSNILKAVYSELPTYDLVIPALLEHGIFNLRDHCKLTPGIPLKPMLAKPTKAIGEVLDRFEGKKFTCEYKYDGERAQVHKLEDGSVRVFSRNSEDMSKKYPDLVEQLPRCIRDTNKSFVLDAEAVAVDKTTGKLLPFQELSRRKRKDVKVEDIQVKVCLFGFDLLYLNGQPLLHEPLSKRREELRNSFQVIDGEFNFAKSSDSETVEDIQIFLDESVKDGCEGLMVKMMESTESNYEPSRRSVNWLKLKKDYLSGVGDSLDLVVVGAYYGKGKRTNVYGAYLLACYDDDNEQYQTICKIGTGFSDEVLAEHFKLLKPLEIEKPRGDIVVGQAKPDIWLKPEVVWEVLAADLSLSPVYTAAQGLVDNRGISLRFPRYIRTRDDKNAEDATGPEMISEMYQRQSLAQPKGGKSKGGDADDGFW